MQTKELRQLVNGQGSDLKQSESNSKFLRTISSCSPEPWGGVTDGVPGSSEPASQFLWAQDSTARKRREEISMASPSHGVSFRGFSISEDSSRIQREAGWPCSPGTKLYEGGRWAGSPGSQRGWLCGSGPTKASLSYRWPPAGAEVAMAPGACHLMTVLALPDVPQTSGAPTKARPAGRPQRPLQFQLTSFS